MPFVRDKLLFGQAFQKIHVSLCGVWATVCGEEETAEAHGMSRQECEVCEHTFIRAKSLRNHKMIHDKAECIHCKEYVSKKNKTNHQLNCSTRRDNTLFKCKRIVVLNLCTPYLQ